MYCKHCGALQDDNAIKCTNCDAVLKDIGQQQPSPESGQTFNQYQTPPPSDQQANNPYQTPPQPMYSGQPQQGYYAQPPQGAKINSWLIPNIIATVLSVCCCPLSPITGIIGIVFAALVSGKEQQGDYAGAQKNANIAKIMFFVTIGITVIGLILNIILFATGAMTEMLYDMGIYNNYNW